MGPTSRGPIEGAVPVGVAAVWRQVAGGVADSWAQRERLLQPDIDHPGGPAFADEDTVCDHVTVLVVDEHAVLDHGLRDVAVKPHPGNPVLTGRRFGDV